MSPCFRWVPRKAPKRRSTCSSSEPRQRREVRAWSAESCAELSVRDTRVTAWATFWAPTSTARRRTASCASSATPPRHEIHDLNVSTSLRGDFGDAHIAGDQAAVLPTDTQKNTAFAYAKIHGDRLARGLRAGARRPAARGVPRPRARRRCGSSSTPGTGSANHAFVRRGGEVRTCVVTVGRDETHVLSGLQDLVLLKSTDSEFKGFLKDEFTTLAETDDRILATSLVAEWRHDEHRRRLERVVRRGARRAALDLRHDVLPRAAGDAARDGHGRARHASRASPRSGSRRPTSTTSSSTSPGSTSRG